MTSSDSVEPVEAETREQPDSWQQLAEDAVDRHADGVAVSPEDFAALHARMAALLAAEDSRSLVEALDDLPHPTDRRATGDDVVQQVRTGRGPVGDPHPPTFHVRSRLVAKPLRPGAASVDATHDREWDWVAVAANGRKLYGSTESYEHKQHAIEQAHSVADPMGAEVRIEGEDD